MRYIITKPEDATGLEPAKNCCTHPLDLFLCKKMKVGAQQIYCTKPNNNGDNTNEATLRLHDHLSILSGFILKIKI